MLKMCERLGGKSGLDPTSGRRCAVLQVPANSAATRSSYWISLEVGRRVPAGGQNYKPGLSPGTV
jgi:hypothetical protein